MPMNDVMDETHFYTAPLKFSSVITFALFSHKTLLLQRKPFIFEKRIFSVMLPLLVQEKKHAYIITTRNRI